MIVLISGTIAIGKIFTFMTKFVSNVIFNRAYARELIIIIIMLFLILAYTLTINLFLYSS